MPGAAAVYASDRARDGAERRGGQSRDGREERSPDPAARGSRRCAARIVMRASPWTALGTPLTGPRRGVARVSSGLGAGRRRPAGHEGAMRDEGYGWTLSAQLI
jgi:hypothetical protein